MENKFNLLVGFAISGILLGCSNAKNIVKEEKKKTEIHLGVSDIEQEDQVFQPESGYQHTIQVSDNESNPKAYWSGKYDGLIIRKNFSFINPVNRNLTNTSASLVPNESVTAPAQIPSFVPADQNQPMMNVTTSSEVHSIQPGNYTGQQNIKSNQSQYPQIIERKTTVRFDFDSYELTDVAKKELDQVITDGAADMSSIHVVMVSGHTDNVGTYSYNKTLSYNRAQSVIKYFKSRGIRDSRVVVSGDGYSSPIASNSDEDGRSLNRRAEIVYKKAD